MKLSFLKSFLFVTLFCFSQPVWAEFNSDNCVVGTGSDNMQIPDSLRSLVGQFNQFGYCGSNLTFKSNVSTVTLTSTIKLTRDGNPLLIDGGGDITIDGTALPQNTCVINLANKNTTITDLTIKSNQTEYAICDHGAPMYSSLFSPDSTSNNTNFVYGTTVTASNDTDGDRIPDILDNCPTNTNGAALDFSGDGILDEKDQIDGDLDGIGNACDACPNDSEPTHQDSAHCAGKTVLSPNLLPSLLNSLADSDNDGVINGQDNCPATGNPTQTDNTEINGGADGVGNACDNCPLDFNPAVGGIQGDIDADGEGDACDVQDNGDNDGDGVQNYTDNCADVPNNSASDTQLDMDGDNKGDVCDDDTDGDGVLNTDEMIAGTDPKKTDTDGDEVSDSVDSCPTTAGIEDLNDATKNGCPADGNNNDNPPEGGSGCSLTSPFTQGSPAAYLGLAMLFAAMLGVRFYRNKI